jgi:hypothetical protein
LRRRIAAVPPLIALAAAAEGLALQRSSRGDMDLRRRLSP